jgi:hypothetical protein
MDTNLMYLIVIGIFAVIVILAFLLFRQRTQVNLKGLFGTGLDVDASNQPAPPTPAIKAEDLKARKGGLKAHDETGRGVDVKQVEVEKDIDLKSTAAPKVPPPA